ncbi:MAG: uracil-DNA glycosylase, partial [Gammaproteobacteria bacterium]|nr:uracil-DNA glycosylase [Thiotrichales bacterium]MBT5361103.1 uracil-DNA glycosylase [Gammaproteobacteria bacterium]MBT5635735.1 uracil-DNA glycosylase [Gammaproteobacteria bacterium]MBT7022265.1 uracil-DNA glycosylase [Gammaproteobacteria bacterium]
MKPKNPNCFDCHHFFVTWDQNFPRGCRAYGIKTPQIPSLEVQQA